VGRQEPEFMIYDLGLANFEVMRWRWLCALGETWASVGVRSTRSRSPLLTSDY
jgi:hypothetical protein